MLSTEYNPAEIVFVLALMIVGQSLRFGIFYVGYFLLVFIT